MTSNTTIAIVGLGCILPDATSPSAAWNNFVRGHSAVRPLTKRTYDWSCYKRESDRARGVFEAPIGAEIGPISFDWRKFRISPLDAQAINPMHLHVLEAGAQAIEEVKHIPHETTGVFVGGTGLGWRRDAGLRIRLPEFLDAADRGGIFAGLPEKARRELLAKVRNSIEERLRPVSDDGVVNSITSVAGGRLALRFDLRGPHSSIDAGFASGLAAVASAVQLLRDGTIDLAVAGAASERITPVELLAFHHMSALAPSRVRPFDAAAEGTLLGEGVVLFALKRLEDALEHGETIYALLRGIGATSDGRSKSLFAPSTEGQSLAMERAYADADIDPNTVGYVECHGTGAPVGDASEIHALARVFGSNSGSSIAIGSAKPFVGHLRGASGAVGLLRAVLALHHRTIPAQIGFETPHPNLEIESTPFVVPVKQLSLEPRCGAPSARAAVSSFGFGGTNCHAVLEAWSPEMRHSAEKRAVTRRPSRPLEPIAIIGLGGVLPDADGVPAFWKSLLDGTDTAREVPSARWSVDNYYDPDPSRLDTTYTRIGCFVDPVPAPGKEFRIPPSALVHIDPGQILAFRAAEEAVADANLEAGNWDRSRTAVILGFLGCQGRRFLAEARLNFREFESELESALVSTGMEASQITAILSETERIGLSDLPAITENTLTGYLGSFNAARIARRFDLQGPHFVIDSACASSLAGLQAAARLLRQGVVDTVLVGGVWADGQPEFFVGNCRFSSLTATAITPFDERASGFVPGEGAAVLVLRRLADAERDGQRIHALVRSIEGSTDGAAGRSVYSPSAEGESLAIKRALEAADIAPGQVDYVECHGTGTALGDVTEIEACTRTYGTGRERPLLVGSVKSNIGHLMAGAGAAALLKTAIAVREGTIPASLKVRNLNPKIDFASGPVQVVTSAKRWEAPAGMPRRAGVNGFGLGGSNYHALLEEYRPSKSGHVSPGNGVGGGNMANRMLPIATAAGGDLASCARTLTSLATQLHSCGSDEFSRAIASSQNDLIGNAPWRVAIVAGEPGLLAERVKLLNTAMARGHDLSFLNIQGIFVGHADPSERVAAVFPGQGPQYANMLRSASDAFPELALTLDRMDRAYEAFCGRKLRPSFFADDAESYLQSDEDIHCAVFAVNVALFELFRGYGARFNAVMGQSAGDLSALVAAGCVSMEDGLLAMRERTLAVLDIKAPDPGRMVTLACGSDRALQLMRGLPGYATIAADNAPSACIVSGDQSAVPVLLTRAANEGVEARVLEVSHGYHSQLIAAAGPRYRKVLDSITFHRPELELYSSITGDCIDQLPPESYPALLESQFVEPVRLRQVVTALYRSGVRVFLQCGPKWPLTTYIGEILNGQPHVAQATIHPKVGEVELLHRAFACMFVHRVCALHPVRESSMSTSNASISLDSSVKHETAAASSATASEAKLLTVLRTIRDLVDDALDTCDATATASRGREHVQAELLTSSEPRSDATSLSPPSSASPAPTPPSEDARQRVQALLLAELVKRTGYPEEMIEPHLDLDGELGIDTIKQVGTLAAVRAQLGIPPDPNFRIRDARTLQQAVDYLASRIPGAPVDVSPSAPAAITSETRGETIQSPALAAPSPVRSTGPTTLSAPSSPASVVPSDDVRQSVHSMLVAELIKRTGYPEEMVEPDLDLEAELGIDTVKQVASLAAVREHYGLPRDPNFRMQDARTLRQAVDYLVGRVSDAPVQLAPSPVTSFKVGNPAQVPEPRVTVAPAPEPASAPSASTTPAIPPPRMNAFEADTASIAEDVHRLLIAELVNRTGYPEDMIEPDLDLEAELGIDTVKQVAAMAAVRGQFGLQTDPQFRMQDARTLRQAIAYLVGRIASAKHPVIPASAAVPTNLPMSGTRNIATLPTPPPSELSSSVNTSPLASPRLPQVAATPDISAAINELQESLKSLTLLVAQGMRSGSSPSETDIQATPSSTAPSRSVYPEVLLESLLPQAGCSWKEDEVLEVSSLAVVDADSILPHPASQDAELRPLHARDSDGQIVANSRLVRTGNTTSSAPPGMLDAVREGRAASNDSLLREYLDKSGRCNSSITEWANSQGFTYTVGGARIPNDCASPARGMLSLLGSAYDVASFAWFGLTGALHSLSAIERLSFHRIPGPGDEMLFCARMARPESGFWRADVAVFDPSGELFAEFSGMEGTPVATSQSQIGGGASDPAERAWRRFAQRLGRDTSVTEDIAS